MICANSRDWNWVLIPFFYFALGTTLSLPNLAIQYYAKDVLKIGPVEMGVLTCVVSAPWFFKFLYGIASDSMPVFGEHRRPYLVVCSAAAGASWLLLVVPGAHSNSVAGMTFILFLVNFFMCFADVVIDCLLAAKARAQIEQGGVATVQATAWMMRHLGSLTGSTVCTLMLGHAYDVRAVFLVTATIPFTLCVFGTCLREPPSTAPLENVCEHSMDRLRAAYVRERDSPVTRSLALFLFIYALTPNASGSFFYFITESLHFSESTVGWLGVVSTLSAIAGLYAYRTWFSSFPTLSLVSFSIVLGSVLSLVQLLLVFRINKTWFHMDDVYFAVGDDIVESFVSQLAMLPLQVIAAAACPDGDEGLLYAGVMSVLNVGGALSSLLGSLLAYIFGVTRTSFTHLWALVVVCSALNLLPLACTSLLHNATQAYEKARRRVKESDIEILQL